VKSLQSLLSEKSNRSIYLSIFRLYICFHLLKKLLFQWTSLQTLYGTDSFVVPLQNDYLSIVFLQDNYQLLIFFYMIMIVLFAFGIGKYFTAFILYILVIIVQELNEYVLDGGDNLLKFLILYLAFANCYEYFSLSKLKLRKGYTIKLSNLCTNLAVYSILIHLCLVYFVSGISKAYSDVWYSGAALYYILSIERFNSGTSLIQPFVHNGYLVTFFSYFTILVELYFPVLVWVKRLRPFVLTCMAFLHLGIYFLMMIHDFSILYITVYGFFFTNSELLRFKRRLAVGAAKFMEFIKERIPAKLS